MGSLCILSHCTLLRLETTVWIPLVNIRELPRSIKFGVAFVEIVIIIKVPIYWTVDVCLNWSKHFTYITSNSTYNSVQLELLFPDCR